MIAEVVAGNDLRDAAAGMAIVTGEFALVTTTITACALLASQWATGGYPFEGPHHLFGKA